MTGANYILVAEAAVADAKTMFITAKLLDVETARTIMTDNVMMATTPEAIQDGCVTLAKKLFGGTITNSIPDSEKSQHVQITPTPVLSSTVTDIIVRNSKSTQKQLGVKKYTCGSIQMDEKELREFLYKNNTHAYKDYMKGTKMISTGWWMLGCGMGAIFAGLSAGASIGDEEGAAIIISFSVIGAAAAASSVPILLIGNKKQKRAFDLSNYNKPALSLNFQTSQNGVGLALKF